MPGVTKQLRFLNKISSTTIKPQIIIGHSVTSIKLTFQQQSHNGHMGARKFWRNFLPTIQFYNPTLPIIVHRISNEDKKQQVPCCLEILGADSKLIHSIEMCNKSDVAIMDELLVNIEHNRVPDTEIVHV